MLRLPCKEEVYYDDVDGKKILIETVEVDNKYYTVVHNAHWSDVPEVIIHRGDQNGTQLFMVKGWRMNLVTRVASQDLTLFAKIQGFSWLMKQFAAHKTFDDIIKY